MEQAFQLNSTHAIFTTHHLPHSFPYQNTPRKDLITNLVLWIDPMTYAFESLLINQFHDATTADGEPLYYLINTTYCASR